MNFGYVAQFFQKHFSMDIDNIILILMKCVGTLDV